MIKKIKFSKYNIMTNKWTTTVAKKKRSEAYKQAYKQTFSV